MTLIRSDLLQAMNPKVIFYWLYNQGKNYNLFMLKVDDYDEGDESYDTTTVVKHQKYATWLYVLLLMGKHYRAFLLCEAHVC